jgi:hypothetical protein
METLREGAFSVLQLMLLGYQHSPSAFHVLVPHIPSLLQHLEAESDISKQYQTQHLPKRSKLERTIIPFEIMEKLYKRQQDPFPVQITRNSDSTLQRFVELVYILMSIHMGFPELYSPLLPILSKYVYIWNLCSNCLASTL